MQKYTRKEVLKNALKKFNGDELAADIWINKYTLKDKEGNLYEDHPDDRWNTIGNEMRRIDLNYVHQKWKSDVYIKLLINKKMIPGGSGIYGIGNQFSYVSLGNCFVISGNNEDSIGSIFKTDQESAQIYKRRGGVGNDLSFIRPEHYSVSNAAGTTTGPIPFGQQLSDTVRRIGQNGRRGALMLSFSVHHPNVLQFIRAKNDNSSLTGANVSLRVSDEFMQAVENDGYYLQKYPVTAPTISMLDMEENEVYKAVNGTQYIKVKAKPIFDELVRVNWESAEPGILFWDQIIRESPADCYPEFQTESTNPCGELPLSPYDSCRLLSHNLIPYIIDPFTSNARFDWESFINDTKKIMRAMDNIIDLEIEKLKLIIKKIKSDPESEFTKMIELSMWEKILMNTIRGRRSGISLIGHGDFLAKLGIKYGSPEALELIEKVHQTHAVELYKESVQLAKERGPFEAWDTADDFDNPFLQRLFEISPELKVEMEKYGRRNIGLLTIPPAGTTSLVLQQTSGIEPVFMPIYKRRRKVNPGDTDTRVDFVDPDTGDSWQEYTVVHPGLNEWFEKHKHLFGDLLPSDRLEDMDPDSIGIQELIYRSPYGGSASHEIDPIMKVKMQGLIQKWVDHSISVTHNLPEDASKETIANLYMTAWKEGCKGCTIYREGSRSGVMLSGKEENSEEIFEYRDAPKRPRELPCDIYFPKINGQQYVVLVGLYENKPYEVFAFKYAEIVPKSLEKGILKKQRSGVYHLLNEEGNIIVEDIRQRFELPDWDFATRMISTALRHGAAIDFVVEQLNKAHGLVVTDYIKVIARQLKKYVTEKVIGDLCPHCNAKLVVQSGCKQCTSCGKYGKCE
jgi:ribonucleoside-diphosphate reductase alpha chain